MIKIQERMIDMTFLEVAEILTDAAIRCNWRNIGFSRTPYHVDVFFGAVFMPGDEDIKYHKFGLDLNGYCDYFDDEMHFISEDEWFKRVDRYFFDICGIHLKDRETAACGD